LAQKLKEIGVDYFSIKPFSKHPQIKWNIQDERFDYYQEFSQLESELNRLEDENYHILARVNSMKRRNEKKRYAHCLGIPFWAYISAQGDVWPCLAFIGDPNYRYGNLETRSFVRIWESKTRRTITMKMSTMNIERCRELCRLDQINLYLEQLKNPGLHVNFI
jgi:cyclic pyranopterin phosphate synthase